MKNKVSGNSKEIKKVNRSLIVSTIKDKGCVTRPQISEEIGVSQTTVRNLLNELLEEDEIIVNGYNESTGGRRAETYSINKDKRLALVLYFIDLGLSYEVLNLLGEIIMSGIIYGQKQATVEVIEYIIQEILEEVGNINGIVVSVPGVVSENGYVSGYKINDWQEYKISEFIREKYNISVVVENDLNVIALGYSKEKNLEDVVYISLTSLGAGAGLVVNNKVIEGSTKFAGEVGCLPYKDSIINNYLLNYKEDEEIVEIIVYLVLAVNCILNPKAIVIGGELFKVRLEELIVKRIKEVSENSTMCNIYFDDMYEDYALSGVRAIALKLIDNKVEIVKK